jgi:chromosome segregation ATPase
MNPVDQSLEILNEALARLERTLAVRLQAEGHRFAALQAEHAALGEEHAALKAMAGRASDQLEHTLTRIDRYLKVTADGAG